MLDEQEWRTVYPHPDPLLAIRELHRNGMPLAEAKEHVLGDGAVRRYFELTGVEAPNAQTVWHHRLAGYGPPCAACGKLLRTTRARFCAECGAIRDMPSNAPPGPS
ncbi:hypothetical protein [Labrys wisconsinensis]|uniref:Zinc ribbon domain-containing protein n=1 Tax=Labrys wisconsinensis TaxID=425677 RepID=A0ABU0JHY1_9HYPH|nr:hypothetical protein [Labrys wisconsinensis]MDQ0472727.1 hypothetical protein [Labrys wisconsinensis]